ncbi:hypothetical protein J27TS8_15460 [Robertmurraya siralis]|uniref:Uncharacterized protein n=1 Tax=Robertmurraya siralis TaxID=77777 RepID=A0A919WGU8_9BACI|nr:MULTISPECIES: hypothetical protein [Robertmurraya]MDF1506562.1 hypothetical protein [Robertmurraya sp. DFI.2.37]GIN61553.1 hypothetical protein J27TS8_15460 [Robertmurraya siralis]
MSLKAIEMQVALPRTHDAGKLLEQMQQRGQLQHDLASESVKREEEKKKNSVIKQEQKDITRFQKERHHEEQSQSQQHGSNKGKQKHHPKEQHPYKGTRVDYSG